MEAHTVDDKMAFVAVSDTTAVNICIPVRFVCVCASEFVRSFVCLFAYIIICYLCATVQLKVSTISTVSDAGDSVD